MEVMSDLPEPVEIDLTDYENEAYTAGDEEIVLDDTVLLLAEQIKAIDEIEDEDERLEAARQWANELNG